MNRQFDIEAEVLDSPVYWFTLMEIGRGYGDFEQAARAKVALERQGIRVIYGPRADTKSREFNSSGVG
jgi:hypothetical protein